MLKLFSIPLPARLVALLIGLTVALPQPTYAQVDAESPVAPADEVATEADSERDLEEIQQSIFARYRRFSKTLTQLYGYMKETDPARAELLLRVIGKSNENRIDSQMEVLLELLSERTPQYAGIVERQDDLIESLLLLLDVLQSEDELQRITDEMARIEDLIKDLEAGIIDQKEVRAGTERGRPIPGLEGGQSDVTEDTQSLADKIDEQDRERQRAAAENQSGSPGDPSESNPSGEPKSSENEENSEESESSPSDPSDPSESKPSESGSPSDSQGKPSESSPSESSPSESKPSESQPSDSPPGQSGQPSDSESPPSESSPSGQQSDQQSQNDQDSPPPTEGREEIENAIERMQKAIDELKEKNRENASREQDRAIADLEKAKAKLEEILRQLREEEQKIMLAALEARFRKMLQMQLTIRKASGQIAKIPEDDRLPRHRARSIQLARDEQDIVLEADKALILLREEGTSVAFPEAVLELREDMRTVSERLNRVVIDELTLIIEDDIIESLEEMIEALRKELEKLEEQEQQEGQPQEGQPQDPALVDLIAELKLLRSLQYRVNRRTKQYGRQIDGEQADDNELLDLLDDLSVRQARIRQATYDLSTGKNQ